ncbi:MAG TPA: VOC family protein, partial [Bacteroidales bacterium]|nr:VOC family protein [Bacteroidales bacterium]
HIGIPVTNLERSVEFYSSLGFAKIHSSHVDESSGRVLVAFMEQRGVIIELYQVTEPEREKIRTRTDGHIDHIAFDVEDADEAFLELSKAGFELIQDKPVFLNFWKRGCKYFAIRGPDGEKLEFNQIL